MFQRASKRSKLFNVYTAVALLEPTALETDLALVAALIGESTRAAMLMALRDGLALPAGELAELAGVSPQTASTHLQKLLDGALLDVETQGRHRFYPLKNASLAQALEAARVKLAGAHSTLEGTAGHTRGPARFGTAVRRAILDNPSRPGVNPFRTSSAWFDLSENAETGNENTTVKT